MCDISRKRESFYAFIVHNNAFFNALYQICLGHIGLKVYNFSRV